MWLCQGFVAVCHGETSMQFIVGVARSWPSIGFSVDLGILVSSYSINSPNFNVLSSNNIEINYTDYIYNLKLIII